MEDLKRKVDVEPISNWRKFEVFATVANHCLLAIVTFYLVWYVFQDNWSELTCVHTFLCATGFFLMTEGILLMNDSNAPTILCESRPAKTRVHWILQASGVILMVSGAIVEYTFRQQQGKPHWDATHAFWGMLVKFHQTLLITMLFAFRSQCGYFHGHHCNQRLLGALLEWAEELPEAVVIEIRTSCPRYRHFRHGNHRHLLHFGPATLQQTSRPRKSENHHDLDLMLSSRTYFDWAVKDVVQEFKEWFVAITFHKMLQTLFSCS